MSGTVREGRHPRTRTKAAARHDSVRRPPSWWGQSELSIRSHSCAEHSRTASAGVAELTEYRAGPSAEAEIITESSASEWRPGFGMLIDRFGVTWVLDVTA
ncbi:hypothetical protein [Leucobacter luti]|uniref:hypothetical protein n=1 Tax=Leucobacter luti TaxID=340320 RepID=UPI001FB51766|nr:hypothetical protein [Leucobacter luti]MCW2287681.1 putative glyoxalase superfamily protein PhnB [Leucobacter luti]